jgi:hypothetical protein
MNRITDGKDPWENPFDTSRWRGWIALTGDIEGAALNRAIGPSSGTPKQ